MTDVKDIRDKILKERGIVSTRSSVNQRRRLAKSFGDLPVKKTPLMRLMEVKHGKYITDLILNGTLGDVEKALNYEVDRTTICKWRKRISKEMLKEKQQ